MSLGMFVWEAEFSLPDEYHLVHEYFCHDPRAKVEGVVRKQDRRSDGSLEREFGALLIRDRGSVGSKPKYRKYVTVVRRVGQLTPIPESCGELLGSFSTANGFHTWLVFLPPRDALALPAEESSALPRREAPAQSREAAPSKEKARVRPPSVRPPPPPAPLPLAEPELAIF